MYFRQKENSDKIIITIVAVSKPSTTHSPARIPRALWWSIECSAERIREPELISGCMARLVGSSQRQTQKYHTLSESAKNQRRNQALRYGTEAAISPRGSIAQTILLLGMIIYKKKHILLLCLICNIKTKLLHLWLYGILMLFQMHDTAVLLSRHFMKERLQYGLYGLYPKYRSYNEPLTIFLGMVGHALVVLTLQADRGSLADQCKSMFHCRVSKFQIS